MKQTPEQRLLKLLKRKKASVTEIANALDLSPKKVMAMVRTLADKGTIFDVVEDTLQLASTIPSTEKPLVIDFRKHREQEFCIGAIADTHIGSKYERLDVLACLYDRFVAAGVTRVFLGGNMIDGECSFNKYDIYVNGVDGQVRNFVEKFPYRKGVVTSFVTGDDHEGWYVQRDHINIGQYARIALYQKAPST
ncbi:MAG: hypothetical protein KBC26_00680 [Candidatus Pacebacteria bacterium]|nr:hypothetical protein [Candidatus Paceibacterota bacterium]